MSKSSTANRPHKMPFMLVDLHNACVGASALETQKFCFVLLYSCKVKEINTQVIYVNNVYRE